MSLARVAAFLAGAGVMALEVVASRWLAPWFGFTVTTWAALISATLLAGAIGAGIGGRLAERAPRARLAVALVAAGAWAALAGLVAPAIARVLAGLPVAVGALLASLLALGPPVAALAAVVPLAAGLAGPAVSTRGLGSLLAFSTAGSLAGTLLAALAGLPILGARRTSLGLAAVLLAAGAAAFRRSSARAGAIALAVVAAAAAAGLVEGPPDDAEEGRVVREGAFGTVEVRRRGTRTAVLVDGVLQGAHDPAVVAPGALLRAGNPAGALPFLHPRGRRAFVVGLGAGVVSRALEASGIETLTIEVDPVLAALVDRHLGGAGEVETGDGRVVLRRRDERRDFLVLDAFTGEALPSHLLTVEAFAEYRDRVAPGGILAVHLIGRPEHRVARAVARTIRSAWPHLLGLSGGSGELQDLWLLASDAPLTLPPHPDLDGLRPGSFDPLAGEGDLLTDDRSPLDLWNEPLARALRRAGAGDQ